MSKANYPQDLWEILHHQEKGVNLRNDVDLIEEQRKKKVERNDESKKERKKDKKKKERKYEKNKRKT